MSAVMPELRTPVMTLVEASWEDASGTLQTVPARMEDKSVNGACIRVKRQIEVGAKLSIQWRFEQFSGTARYCRSEGKEYLVGIQRQATSRPIFKPPVAADGRVQEDVRSSALVASAVEAQGPAQRQPSKPDELPVAAPTAVSMPAVVITNSTITPPRAEGHEIGSRNRRHASRAHDFEAPQRTKLQSKQPSKGKEAGKGRTPMRHKWLELPWRNKQERVSASGQENGAASDDRKGSGKSEKENVMSQATQPMEKVAAHSAREVPNFQVELLPMEDIYRASGIMDPGKGYSIKKVVEMLHSEHIQGLSKEMKRAAVLMALDAAGIPMEQVQRDAKARQDALDSHEAQQRKQVESEWARKAEEVMQIQAELESIKAHYTARIGRNLEGVAREKATFNSWLMLKQGECQRIAEAVELCLKAPASEPASVLTPGVSLVKVSGAHTM
ncbi:MAG: hypothetical protein WA555_09200 [Candidatus Sulfotelmatobacter sp.]